MDSFFGILLIQSVEVHMLIHFEKPGCFYFRFYIEYVTPQSCASSLNREPFVNRFNIVFRIEVLYSVTSIVVVML